MTKNYVNLLNDYLKSKSELREYPKTLAIELKPKMQSEMDVIQRDPYLSPQGKMMKRQEVRDHYAKQILERAYKIKKEYPEVRKKAHQLAYEAKAQTPPKPLNDAQVTTFERSLSQLKRDLMFKTNKDTAIKELKAFIDEHASEPYFIHTINEQFADIAGGILNGSTGEQKLLLGQINKRLAEATETEESQLADAVLDAYKEENYSPFGQYMAANDYFTPMIGKEHSLYLREPQNHPYYKEQTESQAE